MTQIDYASIARCEDYSAKEFSGVVVSLHDLFRANLQQTGSPLISGRAFDQCIIEGPAVLLALSGVNFDACNLGAPGEDARCLILMPMAKQAVVGPIGVRDCLFTRCEFMGIGYTGPDAFIDQLLQVLGAPDSSTAPNA